MLKLISNIQCTCHELKLMLLIDVYTYLQVTHKGFMLSYLQHVSETLLLKLFSLESFTLHHNNSIHNMGMANFLCGQHRICRRSGLCRSCEFQHREWSMGGHEHTCSRSACLPLTAATVTNGKVSVLHSNLSNSLKKLILSASVKLSNSWRSSPREKCLSFPVVTIAVASRQLQHFWHTVIIKNLDEGCTLVEWRTP